MIILKRSRKPIEIKTNDIGCELIINRHMNESGHVRIRIDGVYYMAHRIAYEQKYGKIDDENLVVRHKCDNGNCINPEHLELGTHSDNVQDRVDRNRSAIGSNNGRSKLKEEDVFFIKYKSDLKNSELAKMFSVDSKVIYDIRKNITWKHI